MIINTCTRYVMYEHIRVVKVKNSIIKKKKRNWNLVDFWGVPWWTCAQWLVVLSWAGSILHSGHKNRIVNSKALTLGCCRETANIGCACCLIFFNVILNEILFW